MSDVGPKRSRFERERDLVEIAKLYLHGYSQMEIAAERGLSQSQVSRDLKVLQQRWQASSLYDMNAAKVRELARIDNLEREYWDAWRDSRGERQETAAKQIGTGAAGDRREVSIKKVKLAGEPEYLKGIQWCIEMRCKITGVYQPGRGNSPLGMIDYASLSVAQLERIAAGEDSLTVLISGNSSSDAPGTG